MPADVNKLVQTIMQVNGGQQTDNNETTYENLKQAYLSLQKPVKQNIQVNQLNSDESEQASPVFPIRIKAVCDKVETRRNSSTLTMQTLK